MVSGNLFDIEKFGFVKFIGTITIGSEIHGRKDRQFDNDNDNIY